MTENEKSNIPELFQIESDEEEILTEQEPIRFVLSLKDGGQRLDKLVAGRLSQYSRSRLQRWIEDGHITVNGKKHKGRFISHEDLVNAGTIRFTLTEKK